MIEVDISGTEFSYDMKALAMVFYPEKECRVVEHPEISTEDGYSINWRMNGKKFKTPSKVLWLVREARFLHRFKIWV